MSLPIRGKSWGSVGHAFEVAKRRGAQRLDYLLTYATALWKDCDALGIRADVAFAQADLETGDRQTGIGFQSARWVQEGNPAGIGVVTNLSDGTPVHDFTAEMAARVHATHLAGYAGITPPAEWIAMDYRWDDMMREGYFASATTVDDLSGRWAGDTEYGGKIESRWRNYGFTEPQEQGTMVYRTNIPGLPGGPLETSFPVKLLIAPAWRTNVRPGLKARSPRLSVQHETANPNSLARHDATYLYNGSGGRQASWHITVDDVEAYIGIPLDEVSWQAGDGSGPGNYNGISCELAVASVIVNNASRRAQSQKNAAEIMGKIGARLKSAPPARQHANFMAKNCPAQMRNRGEWSRYVSWYNQFRAMEEAAMRGDTPAPAPEPEIIHIGDTIKAVTALNVRQAPRLAAPILGTLAVGDTVVVNGRFESADGYGWLPVSTKFGDGAVAMGDENGPFIEKVVAPPKPKPIEYAPKMPVRELLLTNLDVYDTAEGITTVNELEFVFVADVVEFTKETPAAQHAGEGAPAVKAAYRAGERAIAAWLVKTKERGWWYLLAGDDDEWVRVPYANTKRVSDAPLLGDDME